jgi:MFS family permease
MSQHESPYAWARLAAALALMTLGGSGMYGISVALAPVQAEFGVTRADAAIPYTLTMLGFGIGGILMGRLSDRFGVMVPTVIGAIGLGSGFVLAGNAASLWQFSLAHGLLVGLLGCSATFAPLVADTALWFSRRRGIAVAICASGNYLAGAVWPPILQYGFDTVGWRNTYIATGIFCAATMLLLVGMLHRRPPAIETTAGGKDFLGNARPLGLSPNALTAVLAIVGVACCVAMSMPQVHIVAYCADLGYGVARGAEMLSLMLGFGIVSRIGSGWVADKVGGVMTLLIGATLQCIALVFYLIDDGLTSLYVASALFGLFQGGIVPSYAIIVREYFPPSEAATRVSLMA